MYNHKEEFRICWLIVSDNCSQHKLSLRGPNSPGTMTISPLRVRNRKSLTSSAASIPSANRCACDMKVMTLRAILSTVMSSIVGLTFCSLGSLSLVDSPLRVSVDANADASAKSPVLCMMEPSDKDSTNVDWTPGFSARRARFSSVEAG